MANTVSPELMAAFRERLEHNGYDVKIAFDDVQVDFCEPAAVPFTGNVHIPRGRVVKRSVVDRLFSKLKF